MSVRSLNEAIFRLGQISADRSLTNAGLLRRLADVAVETLETDIAVLAVFENGSESGSSKCCVRGPWAEDSRDRFIEQSGVTIDERSMAQKLAGLRRGRLYHRPELVTDREARMPKMYSDFPRAIGIGDQAMALYRRSDGVELLFSINKIDGTSPFQRMTLARAGALAPYIAQCWSASWKDEPAWMASLKPQGQAILESLLEGYDDDQIAQRTGLSYHSVRAHLKRLFRDAGVRSRLHLMQACRCGKNTGALEVEVCIDESATQAIG